MPALRVKSGTGCDRVTQEPAACLPCYLCAFGASPPAGARRGPRCRSFLYALRGGASASRGGRTGSSALIQRVRPARRNGHQRNRQRGTDDVHVKRYAGIAGREVSREHHLSDVPDRITEQEDGSGANGGGLEREVLPERDAGRYPDREVRHTDLELEGA
jgi:hypothetical protein